MNTTSHSPSYWLRVHVMLTLSLSLSLCLSPFPSLSLSLSPSLSVCLSLSLFFSLPLFPLSPTFLFRQAHCFPYITSSSKAFLYTQSLKLMYTIYRPFYILKSDGIQTNSIFGIFPLIGTLRYKCKYNEKRSGRAS